jgi:hypothetical protein
MFIRMILCSIYNFRIILNDLINVKIEDHLVLHLYPSFNFLFYSCYSSKFDFNFFKKINLIEQFLHRKIH